MNLGCVLYKHYQNMLNTYLRITNSYQQTFIYQQICIHPVYRGNLTRTLRSPVHPTKRLNGEASQLGEAGKPTVQECSPDC